PRMAAAAWNSARTSTHASRPWPAISNGATCPVVTRKATAVAPDAPSPYAADSWAHTTPSDATAYSRPRCPRSAMGVNGSPSPNHCWVSSLRAISVALDAAHAARLSADSYPAPTTVMLVENRSWAEWSSTGVPDPRGTWYIVSGPPRNHSPSEVSRMDWAL